MTFKPKFLHLSPCLGLRNAHLILSYLVTPDLNQECLTRIKMRMVREKMEFWVISDDFDIFG
jgi:hypothetical protein